MHPERFGTQSLSGAAFLQQGEAARFSRDHHAYAYADVEMGSPVMGVHIYPFSSLTIISTSLKLIAYWVGCVDECRKGAPMMFRRRRLHKELLNRRNYGKQMESRPTGSVSPDLSDLRAGYLKVIEWDTETRQPGSSNS